ncbi:tRNA (adenosine(37)-N6)-threonylcarbamoyltransferase complex dimerization subunit type 1 TsaB [uncultured Shimia sp.]|uniref:tRNA (adenosine(37)-N6)-threonylcarbamoyltransferase complex dimerization subunit type 1 TsaB n=1 Tax=uncultured Shimia sp. TaxID=573152 RepID=UPI00261F11C8|nr:tRNA (adenosine(37)-N6)-threonylcarbamoyltransferase complex dimerization subunit type 1 TsaB [uncultured Shimia sp.]
MTQRDTLVLGFDTSARHCAASLMRGDTVLVSRVEEMARGQAERLMPMLEEVLSEAGVTWRDLDVIGVGVGPGNFTGIRLSVSAARGLALALGVPALGVSTFEATSLGVSEDHIAGVEAPRGQVYVCAPGGEPRLEPEHPTDGSKLVLSPPADKLAENIARIAATRRNDGTRPAPLYIKAADAAPPRDPAPVILP